MMYAATKSSLKKAFTSGVIVDDVSATSKVWWGIHVTSGIASIEFVYTYWIIKCY